MAIHFFNVLHWREHKKEEFLQKITPVSLVVPFRSCEKNNFEFWMQKTQDNLWNFISEKIKAGERPEDAAKRGIKEGLDGPLELFKISSFHFFVFYIFIARFDGFESANGQWLSMEKLKGKISKENEDMIGDILNFFKK